MLTCQDSAPVIRRPETGPSGSDPDKFPAGPLGKSPEEFVYSIRLTLVLVALIAAVACRPATAQVVTSTVGVAVNPSSAAVNPVTNTIYVANYCGNDPTCMLGEGNMSVINGTDLSTQTVQTGAYPYSVAVNSVTNKIYVATCGNPGLCGGGPGAVTVIDGATLNTQSVNAGFYTGFVVVNQVTNMIYAVNACGSIECGSGSPGTVTVIDGNTLATQTVNVGSYANSAAVNTSTNTIYVVNNGAGGPGTVTVIDGVTLATKTVNVGSGPMYAAVDQVHNKIYVTNNTFGTVTVIDGATLTTQTVSVGSQPSPVVVNPNTNTIYVGNTRGQSSCFLQAPSVTVINGSTLSTTTFSICRIGDYPANDSEIDLATNEVYFPCQGRSPSTGLTLTVLDGATNTTTPVAVGDFPNAAVVNSTTNQIYVPNQGDNTVSVIGGDTKLQLVDVTPCRLVDTRQAKGVFGGPAIQGGTYRSFPIPQNTNCNIPSSAAAYSLNVTVVPITTLGYLTIWPTPEIQPVVSTLNSPDGRIKANAAIVPAGVGGAVSVYVSDTTNVILDIDAYFAPAASNTYQFYPLTPCRIVDTRDNKDGGMLQPGVERDYSIPGNCAVPTNATAYSFNVTVLPSAGGLDYLTVWPKGEPQPTVSTLNDNTGTIVANAAIVPAGSENATAFYAHSNSTNLLVDVDGYFAAPGTGGLSMYPAPPCRVLDTRQSGGQFSGEKTVNVVGSTCAPPSSAAAYIFNATVVPPGPMLYLTLWPDGEQQPTVSTLNAQDGFITSNMAIVPTNNGSIDAFADALTQLILDISGYFAP